METETRFAACLLGTAGRLSLAGLCVRRGPDAPHPASCRSARVSGGWAGASVSPRALWVTDTAAARWGPLDHGTTGRWWGTCDKWTQSSPQTPAQHWAGGGVHTTISIHVSISFSCVFFHYQKLWTIILTLRREHYKMPTHNTQK